MITEKRVSDGPEPDEVKKLELMILERAVIEAAVNWRERMNMADESHETMESCESQILFDRAVDALLKARKKQ